MLCCHFIQSIYEYSWEKNKCRNNFHSEIVGNFPNYLQNLYFLVKTYSSNLYLNSNFENLFITVILHNVGICPGYLHGMKPHA